MAQFCARLYWNYEKIMGWCWNHTEAGSTTKSTSYFKVWDVMTQRSFDFKNGAMWPGSENKLLQTLTKSQLFHIKTIKCKTIFYLLWSHVLLGHLSITDRDLENKGEHIFLCWQMHYSRWLTASHLLFFQPEFYIAILKAIQ